MAEIENRTEILSEQQLNTPSITINENIVEIDNIDGRSESIDIYIDNILTANISADSTDVINIYTNGTYDVSDYKTAIVDTPVPSGSITLTENGIHKVKDYENAIVDVSGGGGGIPGGVNVTFKVNDADYSIVSVLAGGTVEEPKVPTVSGYYFKGWYTQQGGQGSQINFPYIPQSDITLHAFMDTEMIVGFTGLSNEIPGLTLTDDIADVPTWTTSTDGNYVSVSNPLDSYWPFSEIAEMTDNNGNVFVKYPKMWMKWIEKNGVVDGVKFSNHQVDEDYFISDAFLDPSDITGDTTLDYFALGKYEGSGSTSKIYSKSGQTCLVNVTRAQTRTACRSYGNASNYYNGYQSIDIQQLTLYNLLCMMYYRTQNIQTVYGGRTGTISYWSSASITGTCDGVSGMNGWNTSTDCVKMLGIENPYGNISKWIDGIVFSGQTIYIKRFPQQYDDTTSNANAMGFSRPSNSSYISALKQGTGNNTRSALYCSSVSGGSATTYVGDYCYYTSNGVVLSAGGYWGSITYAGLWCLDGFYAATGTGAHIGGRLSYRHNEGTDIVFSVQSGYEYLLDESYVKYYYSTDDGETWIQFNSNLNVKTDQIKFKVDVLQDIGNGVIDFYSNFGYIMEHRYISGVTTSDNITLSGDNTVLIHLQYGSG